MLMDTKRPHSYLDDLESFFYILLWMCVAYGSPGNPKQELPVVLNRWCLEDPALCGGAKRIDLSDRYEYEIEPLISESFGWPFKELLRQLKEILWTRYPRDLTPLPRTKTRQTVKEVQEEAKPTYEKFIKAIETAILRVDDVSKSDSVGPDVESNGDDDEIGSVVSDADEEMTESSQSKRYHSDGTSEVSCSPTGLRPPKRVRVASPIHNSNDSGEELPYSSPLQRYARRRNEGEAQGREAGSRNDIAVLAGQTGHSLDLT